MESYIVRLYIWQIFRWKLHDFYPYRAYAMKAGRDLKSVGIKIKLIQISSDGQKDRIYESISVESSVACRRRHRPLSSKKIKEAIAHIVAAAFSGCKESELLFKRVRN